MPQRKLGVLCHRLRSFVSLYLVPALFFWQVEVGDIAEPGQKQESPWFILPCPARRIEACRPGDLSRGSHPHNGAITAGVGPLFPVRGLHFGNSPLARLIGEEASARASVSFAQGGNGRGVLSSLRMKRALAGAEPYDIVSAPLVGRPNCGEIPEGLASDIDGPLTSNVIAVAATGDLAAVIHISPSGDERALASREPMATTAKALALPDDGSVFRMVAAPSLPGISDEPGVAELNAGNVDRTSRSSGFPPKAATRLGLS